MMQCADYPPERKIVDAMNGACAEVLTLISFSLANKNVITNGCEYFKESFYPEMNNPPAPVFSNCKVCVFSIYQSSPIKQCNCHR